MTGGTYREIPSGRFDNCAAKRVPCVATPAVLMPVAESEKALCVSPVTASPVRNPFGGLGAGFAVVDVNSNPLSV